jgi:hypothetical protein
LGSISEALLFTSRALLLQHPVADHAV